MIATSDRQSEVVGDVESDARPPTAQPPHDHPAGSGGTPPQVVRACLAAAHRRRLRRRALHRRRLGRLGRNPRPSQRPSQEHETEVEEVPAAVTAEQRQVYIDQGVEQGRADAEG